MEEKRVYVEVETNLGTLKGVSKVAEGYGTTYYAFLGIPYGKPPLGELRFKAPEPFGSWEGVRDAFSDANYAKQPLKTLPHAGLDLNLVSQGDEDCLFLNVYTNKLPENDTDRLPVMVYIHGGGFLGGTSAYGYFGPDFFMGEGKVVVATVNYRCGAFGFLSLDTEEVPGNAGLKDQTLALEWIRDNIDCFGGDPKNVTLFGVSAGGASIHCHMLSELSKGLFHKAILQSGFANMRSLPHEEPRQNAIMLAEALGWSSVDGRELLHFLQSVPADDIVAATLKLSSKAELVVKCFALIFTPTVETVGSKPFLMDTPYNLMKRGHFNKVPVILGCVECEGRSKFFSEECFQAICKSPDLLAYNIFNTRNKSDEVEVGRKIRDFYFKDRSLPWQKHEKNFEKYITDSFPYFAMDQTRKYLLAEPYLPVYTYLFTDHSRCYCGYTPSGWGDPPSKGTCHGSDEPFFSICRLKPYHEISDEQNKAIRVYVKAWSQFAAVGDPNCEELGCVWKKDTREEATYMKIGTPWELKEGTFFKTADFWNKLTAEYESN